MSDKVDLFVGHVKERARWNNVDLVFAQESHLQYPGSKSLVNGYFIDKGGKREFGVAMGKPMDKWLSVLVHESSHMDQWMEDAYCWKERLIPGTGIEALDEIFRWTAKEIELPPEKVSDYIRRARNVELDCEWRTVQKIREFDLPIDLVSYIQGANSYLFFYTVMKVTRAWYIPGKEPYNIPEVWSLAPKHLMPLNDYKEVPVALMEAYKSLL
ncbi:MAG: hypothetical protein Q7R94_00145 [bacterium]|nr:hypothetical protein [bacterium]